MPMQNAPSTPPHPQEHTPTAEGLTEEHCHAHYLVIDLVVEIGDPVGPGCDQPDVDQVFPPWKGRG